MIAPIRPPRPIVAPVRNFWRLMAACADPGLAEAAAASPGVVVLSCLSSGVSATSSYLRSRLPGSITADPAALRNAEASATRTVPSNTAPPSACRRRPDGRGERGDGQIGEPQQGVAARHGLRGGQRRGERGDLGLAARRDAERDARDDVAGDARVDEAGLAAVRGRDLGEQIA